VTTILQWGNSEGVKGRCDAKCHNAETDHCDCMCGGRYHGRARDGTLGEAVKRFGEEVIERALDQASQEGLELMAASSHDLLAILNGVQTPLYRNRARLWRVDDLPLFGTSTSEDES